MRLLVVEDEVDLLSALERGLKKSGYVVDTAQDGETGLEMAQVSQYDLMILDLNLPRLDGLEVLCRIRETDAQQRILILSARSDYQQRIEGLDLGANDYLVKPFHFGELLARVRSLVSRSFIQHAAQTPFFGFVLNTAEKTVAREQLVLDFTPTEYAILEYLVLNRGTPVAQDALIEHVWGEDDVLFSNSLKVHVSAIRKKLRPYHEQNIIRYAGSGYMMEKENEK